MELGSVFQGMSAAAAIVSAFKVAFDVRKELSRADVERLAADADRYSQSIAKQAVLAASKVRGLTDSMVETIQKKVDKARKDWQDRINTGSKGTYAQATDILKGECCSLLRQMKALNGGSLPDEWYVLWEDLACP